MARKATLCYCFCSEEDWKNRKSSLENVIKGNYPCAVFKGMAQKRSITQDLGRFRSHGSFELLLVVACHASVSAEYVLDFADRVQAEAAVQHLAITDKKALLLVKRGQSQQPSRYRGYRVTVVHGEGGAADDGWARLCRHLAQDDAPGGAEEPISPQHVADHICRGLVYAGLHAGEDREEKKEKTRSVIFGCLNEAEWAVRLVRLYGHGFVFSNRNEVAAVTPTVEAAHALLDEWLLRPMEKALRHLPAVADVTGRNELSIRDAYCAQIGRAMESSHEKWETEQLPESKWMDAKMRNAYKSYALCSPDVKNTAEGLCEWVEGEIRRRIGQLCHMQEAAAAQFKPGVPALRIENQYPNLKEGLAQIIRRSKIPEGEFLKENGKPGMAWLQYVENGLKEAVCAAIPGTEGIVLPASSDAEGGYLCQPRSNGPVDIRWTARRADQLTVWQRMPNQAVSMPLLKTPKTYAQYKADFEGRGLINAQPGRATYELFCGDRLLFSGEFTVLVPVRLKIEKKETVVSVEKRKNSPDREVRFTHCVITTADAAPAEVASALMINGRRVAGKMVRNTIAWDVFTLEREGFDLNCVPNMWYEFVMEEKS